MTPRVWRVRRGYHDRGDCDRGTDLPPPQPKEGRLPETDNDLDLRKFEADGAAPLPVPEDEGYVVHDGARIRYSTHGFGAPVILLHGGLGHSGNWGCQVPALMGGGYRAILIDSRGHGRSSRDARPFDYVLMVSDVVAVMDALHLDKAAFVGWSDGACVALILAGRLRRALRAFCSLAATWTRAA